MTLGYVLVFLGFAHMSGDVPLTNLGEFKTKEMCENVMVGVREQLDMEKEKYNRYFKCIELKYTP